MKNDTAMERLGIRFASPNIMIKGEKISRKLAKKNGVTAQP
jgi:hypothetical protein